MTFLVDYRGPCGGFADHRQPRKRHWDYELEQIITKLHFLNQRALIHRHLSFCVALYRPDCQTTTRSALLKMPKGLIKSV
jgi:hypothetical protein